MKKRVYDILKGKFLVSEDSLKNWRFILFCTLLAIVMISCSHSAERKVHEIAKLHKEVRELRSEFVDTQKRLMTLKMESTIKERVADMGIKPADNPPQKILVLNTTEEE